MIGSKKIFLTRSTQHLKQTREFPCEIRNSQSGRDYIFKLLLEFLLDNHTLSCYVISKPFRFHPWMNLHPLLIRCPYATQT